MKDIARVAGVSLSTVDRVLNNRGMAGSKAAESVLAAARSLGYLHGGVAGPIRAHKFHVIIQRGDNTFLDRLSAAVDVAAARRVGRVDVEVRRISSFNVADLCTALDAITKSDGVGIIPIDHPAVREKLRSLQARGIPIITLVSDVSGVDRLAYVGNDNRAAGRLAGHLIHRMQPGRGSVAIFRGSPTYRGHEERESGCRALLAEVAPDMRVVIADDTRDQVEASRKATHDLIDRYPDLVAIYNVAGGNRGIVQALVEAGCEKHLMFVAHELSEFMRGCLVSGAVDVVLDQNVDEEAELLVSLLEQAASSGPVEQPSWVPLRIFFPENLP